MGQVLLGHELLLQRSMKEEIREREIQLFYLIQVAEIIVFVVVMRSCIYFVGGGEKIF